MSRYVEGENRNQISLEPMCLEDMIAPDAEVRSLEIIIDKMDIRLLGFAHSETKTTGRKPYNPEDMFKLYAYSYFNGIRSSRKIERECSRNIELMWLINGLKPDFKTIADFRKNNKTAIKEAFKKFSLFCCELGLIGKEIVAVDGSKFRASNSRLAYHTEKKLDEKIKHHTKTAEQYIKLLDDCDAQEKSQPKYTKEELTDKIDKINKRLGELKTLKAEVIENGTIYETDKDAKMMKTNNHGADICHNVQIAVDDKNHLIVAVDVTSEAVDKEQLYNISSQAKNNLKVEEITAIADKGYYAGAQFKKCKDDNIVPIVAKANQSFHSANDEFCKDKFEYDESKDVYVCPMGQILSKYKSRESSKSKDFNRYTNQNACMNCPVKDKCTPHKYRTIGDHPFTAYSREVDKRTEANKELYRQRKQLVEHPFGTVKRAFGFSYFLTRGNENVRVESLLHFLVYNMKRVINIVGIQGLKEVLQG
jgi:transposase